MTGTKRDQTPRHVAIIMDGNGRWARRQGMPRAAGHRKGLEAARRVVEAAAAREIPYLTLFAFSEDNWTRPKAEVEGILTLLEAYLVSEAQDLANHGIRLRIIGEREHLSHACRAAMVEAERVTRFGRRMVLTLAFNYGGRWDITTACRKIAEQVELGEISSRDVTPTRITAALDTAGIPDPDVVIRTAGELRVSNFMLWQTAYAELFFSPVAWPDFGPADLDEAIKGYGSRRRTFGNVQEVVLR